MSKILVAAGHSSTESGASSPDGRFVEADLALLLRDLILADLRARGINAIGDGDDGENLPLRDSIALARTVQVACEIHFNTSTNKNVSGVEVLAHPKHKPLAQRLALAIVSATGSKMRGDGGFKLPNSGQHSRLGFVQAGGLVVEVEFLSSPAAMARYMANEDKVARALAEVLFQEVQPAAPGAVTAPFEHRQVEP